MGLKKSTRLAVIVTAFLFLPLTRPEAAWLKLRLQSGRVMEGEVMERTNEHIKLKNDKGEYKIPLKMIDEEGTQELNPTEKKEIVTDKTMADWEKWLETNKAYYNKMQNLQKQLSMSMSKATRTINEAVRANNIAAGGQAAKQTGEQITALIKQMDQLTPPEELKIYQEKIRESFRYTKKSLDVWMLGDQQGYHQYRKRSAQSLTRALEALRDAQRMMGAPPGYSDVMDQSIEQYKKELGKTYR